MNEKSDFISNLGKIYGYYTGGFAGFVIILAILEQMGVPDRVIGYLFLFLTIGVYAFIGIISRTQQLSEYYVAGRRVPAIYNGMATGSDWMSAASFIGMAGTLYLQGYQGLAFILGWTGGYLLVAILLAPYLRKFGQYTVPDFLGARFGGNAARLMGVVVLITASFVYVTAQIVGVGQIASRFLNLSFEVACFVGLGGILVCSMMGGMRAVTWTQVAQYIILIIAYLIPAILMSVEVTGVPIPQLMYGQALEQIEQIENTWRAAGVAVAPHSSAFVGANGQFNMNLALNFFALIFCLMVGTASLPHILMRYFTTPSVRDARKSVAWSLFFIFLLYFTAPAYAAFAKLEVYTNVIGQPIASLPGWLKTWGGIGLVGACDAPNAATIYSICAGVAGNNDGILQFNEFRINPDAIVIATPEIAGLPYVIAGLVAAGGLAAALSTADGLLLAIANALSHDVYYRMIDRNAPTEKRMMISRVLLVIVAGLSAWFAASAGADILFLVAWAFSIAAAGLFAALVMGVWYKGTTNTGALVGMIVGYVVTFGLLLWTEFGGVGFVETFGSADAIRAAYTQARMAIPATIEAGPLHGVLGMWADSQLVRGRVVARFCGIANIAGGIFGVPLAFIVTYAVSKFTTQPTQAMKDFIDSIRVPRGNVKLADNSAVD
ncbi:MAG: sodium:solute symporter family protein [Rhodospirillales bacterium]